VLPVVAMAQTAVVQAETAFALAKTAAQRLREQFIKQAHVK
jgi:hypothetical protein